MMNIQRTPLMAMTWFQQLNIPSTYLPATLGLETVRVHRNKSQWTVSVGCATEILSWTAYQYVEQRLRAQFSSVTYVELSIHYDGKILDGDIFQAYWEACVASIATTYATLANPLATAEVRMDRSAVTIALGDVATVDWAKKKHIDQWITTFYKQRFQRTYCIAFACNTKQHGEQITRLQEVVAQEQQQWSQQWSVSAAVQASSSSPTGVQKSSTKEASVPLIQVTDECKKITIEGRIFKVEIRTLRNGNTLFQLAITDETDSIFCKWIAKDDEEVEAWKAFREGHFVSVQGKVEWDKFMKPPELILLISHIQHIECPYTRADDAPQKRIEFHLHTTMSTMDAVSSFEQYASLATSWGHRALAVTDHATVQAYPEVAKVAKKYGIDVLYGLEANVIDDSIPIVSDADGRSLADATFIVFDVETTGLSAKYQQLIEIAAVKVHQGQIIDEFSSFIRPLRSIPAGITQLTGITDAMVQDAPLVQDVLDRFFAWAGTGHVWVAHNARFDMGFIRASCAQHNKTFPVSPVIDTVEWARVAFPTFKNHKLNTIAEKCGIPLTNHHRALDDTKALAHILLHLLQTLPQTQAMTVADINTLPRDITKSRPFHCTVFARNEIGKKQLYELVSLSHTTYMGRVPCMPKSELAKRREGLLIISGCEKGELFDTVMNKSYEEALAVSQFYDVLEVQPLGMYAHLVTKGFVECTEHVIQTIETIVSLGKTLSLPVIATGNVHYAHPYQKRCRDILIQGITGYTPLKEYELPDAHLKTTTEMLAEFSFLGEDVAYDIVVTQPQYVYSLFEAFSLFPKKLFTPHIAGAEEEMQTRCYDTARRWYGEMLPHIVQQRLEKELQPIIRYGFSANYLISERLVRKSNEEGYLVGSRGSVGSSFVATLLGISEVNPLPPHYVCPTCQHSQWDNDPLIRSGYDLPPKTCPSCGDALKGEGQDIPFETFLGFQGDKVPDIDLNFSGEYQAIAHRYTKELFGEKHVFRAGTIGTVAEKTAFGFVKKFMEGREETYRGAQMLNFAQGCTGARRSTGQHPGGIVVVPNDMDIHEITPIQYPADDKKSEWYTTHFDYHAFEENLLKLDILGHDDPTMMRMLYELTGKDPKSIPMNDPQVIALFSSTTPLAVTPEQIRSPVATYGIPEMGTRFVRQMLVETKPNSFADLIQISGLSHGTGVWVGNAQQLIQNETCTIKTVIGCRDDIMLYLLHRKGLDALIAFKIMESVRKGKGLTEEWISEMKRCDVPAWYIEACQRIDYMFPKAHAAAYVLSAVRCAYYKLYYPIAFYATYFSIRADDVELDVLLQGYDGIQKKMTEIEQKGFAATAKEKNALSALEVALEMTARGFSFWPLDIKRSDASKFCIEGTALIPPFRVIPGLGETVAKSIIEAREQYDFLSVEDFHKRTKVSKTIVELLQSWGSFQSLPQTNQLTFF